MRFEWDPGKAKANERKHKVGFSEACLIFADKFELTLRDEAHSDDEERWITVGQLPDGKCLVVVHTFSSISGEEAVRIISARTATKPELKLYHERRKGAR